MLLDAGILKLADMTAKETGRYSIGGLLVEPNRVLATDGRMLAICLPTESYVEDAVPKIAGINPVDGPEFPSFIVPRSLLERVTKQLPKASAPAGCQVAQLDTNSSSVKVNGNPRTVRIGFTDLDVRQIVEAQEDDGVFPATDKIIPTGPIHVSVCLNFKYLERIYKALLAIRKTEGEDEESVMLDIPVKSVNPETHEANGPVMVRAATGATKRRFLGVLMPVNTDGSRPCPDDFTRRGAKEVRERIAAERARCQALADDMKARRDALMKGDTEAK